MKKILTKYDKLGRQLSEINHQLCEMASHREAVDYEFKTYCKHHRSVNFDGLETSNVDKLKKIYKYMDRKYPVEWEGGLRCDDRGMKLNFWLDNDPDYLIIHLTSTSKNICFSGSTSWIVKAPTLDDKVKVIKTIKQDVNKILG